MPIRSRLKSQPSFAAYFADYIAPLQSAFRYLLLPDSIETKLLGNVNYLHGFYTDTP
ncbi:MAG: hypothetical protein F6K22_17235 [Okeania sp. SIO2F4]|uniref:hypothetical protein n=1 Tax=Okeania sp. SIO2F4 TaxID=2607790 RepID=UPI0014297DB0|nr:hypothetical protein [Okeania sp. SIO2F4]NES04423.1 hypothetical protein [Okeania sp. SIO2F4]